MHVWCVRDYASMVQCHKFPSENDNRTSCCVVPYKSSGRMVQNISSSDEFDKLLESPDVIILVDYFTTWCGPCKKISPFITELAKKYPTVAFCKVDADQHEDLCTEWKVECFPTFHFFFNGVKLEEVKSADPEAVEKKLKKLLVFVETASSSSESKPKKRKADAATATATTTSTSSSSSTTAAPPTKKAKKTSATAGGPTSAESTSETAVQTTSSTTKTTATTAAADDQLTAVPTPTKRKSWKVKPQNNEGVLVPCPKMQKKSSGITVTDYILGNGQEPKLGSKVHITYEGSYPDGTVFDARLKQKQPFMFRKGTAQVIRGLDLGIEGMRIGGSREILIPPSLG